MDNDGAGKDALNKMKISQPKKYDKLGTSKNFYVFVLRKKKDYDEDFTIENCYSPDKYEQAVTQAVSDKKGHFAGLSIDKIADDIKNKSKTLLANSCKSFADNDFEGFKPIFDIIEEIRQL